MVNYIVVTPVDFLANEDGCVRLFREPARGEFIDQNT